MITPPPSWKRAAGEHMLVLTPPRGDGRIRLYAQLAPRRFRGVVAEVLRLDPGFVASGPGEAQRAVTREGEYGAWLELSGTYAGRPARRWIGAVFLDFFVAAIDGLSLDGAADAEIGEWARAMFEGATFGAGPRRRRYVYAPPPGWQALPTGLIATWYPPEYPRHRSQIVVYPAEPSRRAVPAVFHTLLEDEERRGFARLGPVSMESFASPLLSGYHYAFAGSWPEDQHVVYRHATVLSDSRYYYVARLESAVAERVEADAGRLRALASPIEPLPHRGAGALAAEAGTLAELGGPWAD